jgi:hypothetical protein
MLETKWLTIRNNKVPADTFSCVDPKLYADRFHIFMQDNLFDKKVEFRESVVPNILDFRRTLSLK